MLAEGQGSSLLPPWRAGSCFFLSHSFLLSRLPAFNSPSCFRANLLSRDTRYNDLCPGDVIFHQAHLLLTRVILQNLGFAQCRLVQLGTAASQQLVEMGNPLGRHRITS